MCFSNNSPHILKAFGDYNLLLLSVILAPLKGIYSKSDSKERPIK
jgi:hypothetical protein